MLDKQELKPCARCEDGSMRAGGFVSLPVTTSRPGLEAAPEDSRNVSYQVHECSVCGATEFTRSRERQPQATALGAAG
jgi:hypothetical protein